MLTAHTLKHLNTDFHNYTRPAHTAPTVISPQRQSLLR